MTAKMHFPSSTSASSLIAIFCFLLVIISLFLPGVSGGNDFSFWCFELSVCEGGMDWCVIPILAEWREAFLSVTDDGQELVISTLSTEHRHYLPTYLRSMVTTQSIRFLQLNMWGKIMVTSSVFASETYSVFSLYFKHGRRFCNGKALTRQHVGCSRCHRAKNFLSLMIYM
ncbi:uncharacterized protein LOC130137650 [Syzygium oleosum]|uniref:uncharacterized protein LOC130137650 n=1 Tax=Syzygium oleosum TaxID=219896 RepID=UPI0024B992CE|nr:uncharacterized protein LOC130137650 [Syzygium oleosum]